MNEVSFVLFWFGVILGGLAFSLKPLFWEVPEAVDYTEENEAWEEEKRKQRERERERVREELAHKSE